MNIEAPELTPGRRSAALQGLIVNPSATPEVLRRLIRRPGAAEEIAWSSPGLDTAVAELLLELDRLDVDVALTANGRLPEKIRRQLAGHPDPEVRAGVPADGLATDLVELLAADEEAEVRAAVARHEAPLTVRERLAADPSTEVRAALAGRPDLPESIARLLLTDEDPAVREEACRADRPVPEDLHEPLLADPTTREWILPHLRLTAALAGHLARDPEPRVRARLVDHPDLPLELHAVLEADRDGIVRHAVLFSRWLDDGRRAELLAEVVDGAAAEDEEAGITDFLVKLSGPFGVAHWLLDAPLDECLRHLDSPVPELRRAAAVMAGRHHPEVSERASRHSDPTVRSLSHLGSDYAHSLTWSPPPRELMMIERVASPELAASEYWEARAFTAAAPGLPVELIERLAADPEPRVRASAAVNPDLPLPSLATLLADRSLYVAEAAGASPALPVEWMLALLTAEGL